MPGSPDRRLKKRHLLRPAPPPIMALLAVLAVALAFAGWRYGDDVLALVSSDRSEARAQSSQQSEREGPAAPPVADPEAAAQELCEERLASYQGREDPFNVSLLAAYPSSAGDVAAEEKRRRGSGFRSPFRERAPSGLVAVCFFEADAFGVPAPPGPGQEYSPHVHTRLEEVVGPDGLPYVLRAGRSEVKPAPISRGDES